MVLAGLILFSAIAVFQLVNLPVEFDASRRARLALVNAGLVSQEEDVVVGRVLHAAAYAEHRPDYPADGIRWVLAGADHAPRQVLDLAAGTGKLTEGLLALGLEVTAVEPDPDMRAALSRRLPGISPLDGTGERIPLPTASVDAVFVGQAFHWFDATAALTEIARVLRPGGVLGALWNEDDLRVEWVAALAALNRTDASRREVATGKIPKHPAFQRIEREVFPHSQTRTADSLTATIGTHSHTLVVSDAARADLLSLPTKVPGM